jgi:hypothetical protein
VFWFEAKHTNVIIVSELGLAQVIGDGEISGCYASPMMMELEEIIIVEVPSNGWQTKDSQNVLNCSSNP